MKFEKASLQKFIVIAGCSLVVIYFLCQLVLFPTLKDYQNNTTQINALRLEIDKNIKLAQNEAAKKKLEMYPREKQLSFVVTFLERKFKELDIYLTSMHQSSEDNRLTLDLVVESKDTKFLDFLDSLAELNTLIIIDNIDITQKGVITFVKMRILTGYL